MYRLGPMRRATSPCAHTHSGTSQRRAAGHSHADVIMLPLDHPLVVLGEIGMARLLRVTHRVFPTQPTVRGRVRGTKSHCLLRQATPRSQADCVLAPTYTPPSQPRGLIQLVASYPSALGMRYYYVFHRTTLTIVLLVVGFRRAEPPCSARVSAYDSPQPRVSLPIRT